MQAFEGNLENEIPWFKKARSDGTRTRDSKGLPQLCEFATRFSREVWVVLIYLQVTDARATMALYRLHKTAWEQSIRPTTEAFKAKLNKGKGKRKRDDESQEGDEQDSEDESERPIKKGKQPREEFPGGGRKGVSSGLSVVIRRGGKRVEGPRQRGVPRASTGGTASGGSWWEEM